MKTFLFSCILIGILTNDAFPATLTISPASANSARCPVIVETYFVTANGGLPACTYTWIVTGGVIDGPNTGTSIGVKWNDLTGTGTLKVTASGCNPSGDNGSTVTNTYTRLSVVGLAWGTTTATSYNQPLCSNATISLFVDPMVIAGTGGINQPARKEVDRYLWNVPAGWKQFSTNVPGGGAAIQTLTNSIQLVPTSTLGASITVRGSVQNTCGSTALSGAKTLTITRTPAMSLTPPAGFTGVTCGRLTSFTYTSSTLPCANSYVWTVPSGLSGTSTTNSISLAYTAPPSGGATSYSLKIDIPLSTGYTFTKTINIPYTATVPPPTWSYGNTNPEICSGDGNNVFFASIPVGYSATFGFDYYGTGGILVNGVAASAASPYHTTSNSTPVTVPGSSYGLQFVGVRMNNGICPPSAYVGFTKRVGVYNSSDFSIIGNAGVCANSVASFNASLIGTGGITGYQWSAPNGWSNSGQGTPYFSVSVPTPFFGGAITLRLQNRCGLTNTPYVLNLYNSCGFMFSASPNPAKENIVISDLDPEQETTVVLVDTNNKYQRRAAGKAGKLTLDVADLPNGLYILQLKQKSISETQQILIDH